MKDLARELAQRITNPDPGVAAPESKFNTATVTAVGGTDGTVTLLLSDGTTVAGVRKIASVQVVANQVVRVERYGPTLLVVGVIRAAQGPIVHYVEDNLPAYYYVSSTAAQENATTETALGGYAFKQHYGLYDGPAMRAVTLFSRDSYRGSHLTFDLPDSGGNFATIMRLSNSSVAVGKFGSTVIGYAPTAGAFTGSEFIPVMFTRALNGAQAGGCYWHMFSNGVSGTAQAISNGWRISQSFGNTNEDAKHVAGYATSGGAFANDVAFALRVSQPSGSYTYSWQPNGTFTCGSLVQTSLLGTKVNIAPVDLVQTIADLPAALPLPTAPAAAEPTVTLWERMAMLEPVSYQPAAVDQALPYGHAPTLYSYIAEDAAQVMPEIVAWDYSDKADPDSGMVPVGINVGALATLAMTGVQSLLTRVAALEAAS